ncbi:MAG: hypothetical protein FJX46_00255 [Alphaproteobacteria bacterium]|nr:hypothetical protein [Alphaproteobacteria bacterium]
MAFTSKNLSVIGYANGFTLWHYTTTDAAATVDTQGYFNNASNVLRKGDFLFVHADTAGTPAYGVMVVTSNASGVVNAGDMVSFKSADTD